MASGNRDKERLLWSFPEAHSQWVGEGDSAGDILVSVPHTPQIPNGAQDMQLRQTYVSPCMCEWSERGERRWSSGLLLIRGGGGDEASEAGRGLCLCWPLQIWGWTGPQCTFHYSALCGGPGECRSSYCGQQSTRWLDELHPSKWTLLISARCYMEHLRARWVQDKTTMNESRAVQNCLLCSTRPLSVSSSHFLSAQVASPHPTHFARLCLFIPLFFFFFLICATDCFQCLRSH